MDALTKRIALVELRKLKDAEREYREDVAAWYRSGDGRSPKWYQGPDDDRPHNYGGKGYAYPRCPHGSSRWTDYDNICGPCEDGYSVYQLALMSARVKAERLNAACEWVADMPSELRHTEIGRELRGWMSDNLFSAIRHS